MALLKCYDPWLVIVVILLVLAGLFMVGSSTSYLAMHDWKDASALYWRQGIHAVIGMLAMLVAIRFRYRLLAERPLLIGLFLGCLLLLVAVLFMPAIGGAHRWIIIGLFRFQPSELAKLFVVLFVAFKLAHQGDRLDEPRQVLIPCLVVVGSAAVLVLAEPDLGSAAVLALPAGAMLFGAGLRWKYIFSLASLCALGVGIGILVEPFRFQRIVDFVYYALGLREPSYQLKQSLIAIGRGGLTGVGPGQGVQKLFFLPAAHTDFIFSIVGEETGLVGTGLLLLAFLVIFWRGMRTCERIRDPFGSNLALGLTVLIVGQGLLHIAVCVGMLPTTGLTLPFISYGGSSLVASMIAMGLLINVSQDCNLSVRLDRESGKLSRRRSPS